MASRRVLISGASIAGPTWPAGWPATGWSSPSSSAPDPRVGGQNIDVRGAAREVPRPDRGGRPGRGTGERGLAFVDGSGRRQAEFPVTGTGRPTAPPPSWRSCAGTWPTCFERTRDRRRVFGDQIAGLDERATGPGASSTVPEEFDLVVAAEGLRSRTREIAMPGAPTPIPRAAHRLPDGPPRLHRRRLVAGLTPRERVVGTCARTATARPGCSVVPVAVVRVRPDDLTPTSRSGCWRSSPERAGRPTGSSTASGRPGPT